jgi:2-oxoglutarate ferredoxin oxidoreductase subunit alpha
MPSQGDVMQARWGTHGDHPIIALCPRGVREVYDLTIRAFNLAELFRTPVVLLYDEIVGHTNEKVQLPETVTVVDRARPDLKALQDSGRKFLPYEYTDTDVPPMLSFGEGQRFHVTGLAHDETGFPTNNGKEVERLLRRLHRKIERHSDQIIQVDSRPREGAQVGVVSYGSTARSAQRAVRMLKDDGIPASYLALLTLWPFPEKAVQELAASVSHIVVPELNLGQIAHEVEWASRGRCGVHSIQRVDGEPIRPAQIADRMRELCHK